MRGARGRPEPPGAPPATAGTPRHRKRAPHALRTPVARQAAAAPRAAGACGRGAASCALLFALCARNGASVKAPRERGGLLGPTRADCDAGRGRRLAAPRRRCAPARAVFGACCNVATAAAAVPPCRAATALAPPHGAACLRCVRRANSPELTRGMRWLYRAAAVNVLLLRNSLQLRPRPELSPTELLSLVASKLLDLGAEQVRTSSWRFVRLRP